MSNVKRDLRDFKDECKLELQRIDKKVDKLAQKWDRKFETLAAVSTLSANVSTLVVDMSTMKYQLSKIFENVMDTSG